MLENFVEIDETFIGMKERNGELIARVVPNTQQNTLEPIIKENVKQGTNVYTDE
ncbi:3480_t:CDS:2 [Entrophospora sp. SA101]|nr:372_t:CDS:2 [Entrophospora sp. SA101]CAJ0747241.1 3480_t:CDS:2 [Entrophospora sp. SA101]CAJ0842980.1 13695_t:CDS:2 [Entrophospora sp. SA101]CAJ0917087.1 7188_t:CDS:2 [Entrophospora sp. SA101]